MPTPESSTEETAMDVHPASSTEEETCAVCGKPIRPGAGRFRARVDGVVAVHEECDGEGGQEGAPRDA